MSRSGSLTRARARVRRRFMPPDRASMRAPARWTRAANSSRPGMRASSAGRGRPK